MSGKYIVVGLLLFSAVFGATLYYFQLYAFYEKITDIKTITVSDKVIQVTNYRGLDSTTSGLKLRGCFDVAPSDFKGLKTYERATPLKAPFWFSCFDNRLLQASLDDKSAKAFLAAINEKDGIDRIVAVLSNGKAYQWRQLNAKYMD